MRIDGRVVTDAEIAPEWDVKFTDEARGTLIGHTAISADGGFAFEIGKLKPKGQPQLTFWISRGDRLIAVLEPEMAWDGDGATTVELRVPAPPKATYLLAGRVWDEAAGGGVGDAQVTVVDRGGAYTTRTIATGSRGLFVLELGFVPGREPDLAFSLPGRPVLPATVAWDDFHVATPRVDLAWRIAGRVVDRATGAGAGGVRVEAWAGSDHALGAGDGDADGAFELFVARTRGVLDPPAPTFRVFRAGQLLATVDVPLAWDGATAAAAKIDVGGAAPLPAVYAIDGTIVDRRLRSGAPDVHVEAWDPAGRAMLAVADTDARGRFAMELAAGIEGAPPDPRLRAYRAGQLLAQPDAPVVWSGTRASVFIEADVPGAAPRTFRIAGRLIDRVSRAGLDGLRVEAWDKAPRDGGSVGVAAVTGADGAFEIAFPAAPAPVASLAPRRIVQAGPLTVTDGNGDVMLAAPAALDRLVAAAPAGPPALFVRIYAAERLLDTVTPDIAWTPEGIGTVVVETAAPAVRSQEVGLHELGESIAGTVARVQQELARYPTTMGAYVLDEIDLDMPVEMRVDELGQVRTKVVDATTPDKNVGQVHMKVRPVLGAREPASDVADQPLSSLPGLTGPAIERLQSRRIYSVEDLLRAAATGAGRAGLADVDLGVDLGALLAVATLLAFAGLPRALREALVALGVPSLAAFAKDPDPAGLATRLSGALEQKVGEADVTAWQATARAALAVRLPSEENI